MILRYGRTKLGLLFYRQLLCLSVLCGSACASSNVVFHTFQFDTGHDEQGDVEILDYRYGSSKEPTTRAAEADVKRGRVFYTQNVTGLILRGKDLYVKWRLKSTGKIYEDTVDLESRLPNNIENCQIYFIVRGEQLFVYLITDQRRLKDEPPVGPAVYKHRKVLLIYPDNLSEGKKK